MQLMSGGVDEVKSLDGVSTEKWMWQLQEMAAKAAKSGRQWQFQSTPRAFCRSDSSSAGRQKSVVGCQNWFWPAQ
jgi:hypothetical protein